MASLSDRIRYYWPDPRIQQALKRLLNNLSNVDISSGLVKVNEDQGVVKNLMLGNSITPGQVILASIQDVLEAYDRAAHGLP
jgi:D-tagatose-1,6-bisphosphate aldolase subunit GatZ/KbaZ